MMLKFQEKICDSEYNRQSGEAAYEVGLLTENRKLGHLKTRERVELLLWLSLFRFYRFIRFYEF